MDKQDATQCGKKLCMERQDLIMIFNIGVQDRVMFTITEPFPYKSNVTVLPPLSESSVDGAVVGNELADLRIVFVDEKTARIIRRRNPRILIVIMAEPEREPLELFHLHPFDVIYPPVEKEIVWRILSDALRFYSVNPVLVINKNQKIPLAEIILATADGHNVQISTVQGAIRVNTTFSTLLESLSKDRRFLAVNRGVVVNMAQIAAETDDSLTMSNGRVVPIRVKGRHEVHSQIIMYSFNKQLW